MKKTKLKKESKKTLPALKKKAWRVFSEFTRKKFANKDGFSECITCKKMSHWKDLHAGHFVAGRGNSILFDERGTNPQCFACNVFKHGDWTNYYDYMKEKYGEQEIERIKTISRIPRQFSHQELLDLMTKYKEKIEILGIN